MNYSLHRLDSKYTSNCISIAYNFRLQCSEWYALTCLVHVNKFMPKSVNSVRRKNVGRNIILNRNYQKFVMVYAACIQTLGVEATIYWNKHRSYTDVIVITQICNSCAFYSKISYFSLHVYCLIYIDTCNKMLNSFQFNTY